MIRPPKIAFILLLLAAVSGSVRALPCISLEAAEGAHCPVQEARRCPMADLDDSTSAHQGHGMVAASGSQDHRVETQRAAFACCSPSAMPEPTPATASTRAPETSGAVLPLAASPDPIEAPQPFSLAFDTGPPRPPSRPLFLLHSSLLN